MLTYSVVTFTFVKDFPMFRVHMIVFAYAQYILRGLRFTSSRNVRIDSGKYMVWPQPPWSCIVPSDCLLLIVQGLQLQEMVQQASIWSYNGQFHMSIAPLMVRVLKLSSLDS